MRRPETWVQCAFAAVSKMYLLCQKHNAHCGQNVKLVADGTHNPRSRGTRQGLAQKAERQDPRAPLGCMGPTRRRNPEPSRLQREATSPRERLVARNSGGSRRHDDSHLEASRERSKGADVFNPSDAGAGRRCVEGGSRRAPCSCPFLGYAEVDSAGPQACTVNTPPWVWPALGFVAFRKVSRPTSWSIRSVGSIPFFFAYSASHAAMTSCVAS